MLENLTILLDDDDCGAIGMNHICQICWQKGLLDFQSMFKNDRLAMFVQDEKQ